MNGLRLIADDLTGALDSGCAFADTVNTVRIGLAGRARPVGPRVAVSTESRDMNEADAILAVTKAVRELVDGDPGTLWFKKIDSVMRGHPFAETKAALQAGGFARCVFAPAYPDMGRITTGTRQYVVGRANQLKPTGRDFREAFLSLGLRVDVPTFAGGRTFVQDADGIADIHVLQADNQDVLCDQTLYMRAALPQPGTLWVGAGGLAAALGKNRRPALFPPICGVIVGTTHPATEEQTRRAIADRTVWSWNSVTSQASGLAPWLFAPSMSAGSAGETNERLREHIPMIDLPDPERASVVVTGGDTLSIVLAAAGADFLECIGQAVTGVPVSRIQGGRWHGLTLLSKSGGFGGPALLAELISYGNAREIG